MNIRKLAILAIVALAAALQAPSAFAQATRTFVSGVGSDASTNCSRTTPCRTFSGAMSKTFSGGEISTLDPGNFGTVTITKSISIISNHRASIDVVGGATSAITVNAPAGAEVILEGLDLKGFYNREEFGLNGVRMTGLGKLTIRKSTIRDFGENAIDIQAQAGVSVVIEDVELSGCDTGLRVNGVGVAGNTALMVRSLINDNTKGIVVAGRGNMVKLADNVFANTTDLVVQSGAAAVSFGGNVMETGTPTRTVARK